MSDRYWPNLQLQEFKTKYNQSSDDGRPLIGVAFDFKVTTRNPDGSRKQVYAEFLVNLHVQFVQSCGGRALVIGYDDTVETVGHLLDGLLIAGGRDLHPKHYGEEINGSFVPNDSEDRWESIVEMYNGLPKSCPIFGICWGMQFINVIQGGSMIQNIADKSFHYCKRKIELKQGSWFGEICGQSVTSICFHHQVIDRLGRNIEVVGLDDHSKYAHAIELKEEGRFVVGVQFHPESTFNNESNSEMDPQNLAIFARFVEKCKEYQNSNVRENPLRLA